MEKLKKISVVFLAFVLIISASTVSNACTTNHDHDSNQSSSIHEIQQGILLGIPHIYRQCKCGQWNMNYGYDKWYSGGTDSFSAGTLCLFCNSIVPSGERHVCTYWEDRYFFYCSSCGRYYTTLEKTDYTDHYVVSV